MQLFLAKWCPYCPTPTVVCICPCWCLKNISAVLLSLAISLFVASGFLSGQCVKTSWCSTDSESPHRCCRVANKVENFLSTPHTLEMCMETRFPVPMVLSKFLNHRLPTRSALDNDECHVTAFRPISEAAHSWSYDKFGGRATSVLLLLLLLLLFITPKQHDGA